ncbi:hypothetical protein FDG2_3469 [Candidatus Protofrankia californiensis]|uniref:Uncharacterized protein n=1 Tax=Candidatus Protofrankia californiensis TaxID=1839754 RepID=A0A1C3NZP0_9ACTN|nr:hypothetical protein FDG2_3469 [Candidatus Protofrankia californiensis]
MLRLRRDETSAFIEVWDNKPATPAMPEQSLDQEHGRGLFLVASPSRRWHYYHPQIGGKVVWCELPIHISSLEDTRKYALCSNGEFVVPFHPVKPLHFMDDPALLRRVQEGLQRLGDDSEGGDTMR